MDAHVFNVIAAGMEDACKIIIQLLFVFVLEFQWDEKKCCKNFITSFDSRELKFDQSPKILSYFSSCDVQNNWFEISLTAKFWEAYLWSLLNIHEVIQPKCRNSERLLINIKLAPMLDEQTSAIECFECSAKIITKEIYTRRSRLERFFEITGAEVSLLTYIYHGDLTYTMEKHLTLISPLCMPLLLSIVLSIKTNILSSQ